MSIKSNLFIVFFEEVFYFFINSIYHDDWGFYFTVISKAWIFLTCFDIHLWTHTLSGNLYQSKFTWRQYFMFCPIIFHFITKMIIKLFAMSCICHVDEVNDNNASHISQS